MAISPLAVAKRLGNQSDWSLSNLSLQKICYIAHMIHLGRNGIGEPLIDELFEAWNLGPVAPSLYDRAKIFGSGPVQNVFRLFSDGGNDRQNASIDEAFNLTKGMTPGRLVGITHWKDGAWAHNYVPNKRGVIIPNKDILREFSERTKPKPS